MNKRIILIGAGILAVAVVLLIVPKIFFKAPTTTTTTTAQQQADAAKKVEEEAAAKATADAKMAFPLAEVTIGNLSTQARKEFEFASGKAKEWKEDAIPVAVTASYTKTIDPKNGKNTYIFVSPSMNQYYFTLTLDQNQTDTGMNSFQRILYFKEDYFLPKTVGNMPIKYWKVDYIEALQKADASGGKDIRVANSEYDINMVLSAEQGENLTWKVEYLVGGKQAYSISYDAYTGEVIGGSPES
ncbi:MAG TPA: hypothetical protein P5096_01355 [Patescibacteria group bacterium]|nr:hypothetical protein [Patescibacteria group bacterium]